MQLRTMLVLVVLLTACTDSTGPVRIPRFEPVDDFAAVDVFPECEEDTPVAEVPAEVRDSIILAIGEGWHDGDWAAIARRVPGGFGGMWISGAGRQVIGLVDTTQRAAALEALATEPALAGWLRADARVVPVRWSFAQLMEWSRYLRPTIWAEPELTSEDRDERDNRIVVGVTTEEARDRLLEALRARGDVPCHLIRIEPGFLPVPL